MGEAPMVTFGGALTLFPVGEEVADELALAGYANSPSLLGIDLGACSLNWGVRHPTEKWWGTAF